MYVQPEMVKCYFFPFFPQQQFNRQFSFRVEVLNIENYIRERFKKEGGKLTTTGNMGQYIFCFSFCVFAHFSKISMYAWGKNPKMLVFTRVYVCVKAKITLVSLTLRKKLHLSLLLKQIGLPTHPHCFALCHFSIIIIISITKQHHQYHHQIPSFTYLMGLLSLPEEEFEVLFGFHILILYHISCCIIIIH